MNRFQNKWSSGPILACYIDVDTCFATACLPCVMYAENIKMLHGGNMVPGNEAGDACLMYCLIMTLSACTLQCLYAYNIRTDIRRKYDLEENPCDDCCTHIWCHFCALCQEHRELKMHPLTAWPIPVPYNSVNAPVHVRQPVPHVMMAPPNQIQMQTIPNQQVQYLQQMQMPYPSNLAIMPSSGYPNPNLNFQQQQQQRPGQSSQMQSHYNHNVTRPVHYNNAIVQQIPNPKLNKH